MIKNKQILKGILATLSIVLLASCHDNEFVSSVQEEPAGGVRKEVSATLPGGESQTRTSMGGLAGDKYPVLWEENDRIGLSNGGFISAFTLKVGAGTKEGRFEGNGSSKVAGASHYAACYPFDSGKIKAENGELVVGGVVPVVQTYKANSFQTNVYPMAAVSSADDDFQFYNLASVLQLNIKSNNNGGTSKIKRIILTGNDGEEIAGGVTMHFGLDGAPVSSDNVAWSTCKMSQYNPEGVITLDLGAGVTLSNRVTTFNIVVIPQTFEHGFNLRIIDENGGTFEKKTTSSIILKRSYTRVMADFDYSTPEPLETANSYIISDAGYYTIPAFCMGNRQGVLLNTANRNLAATILWTDTGMEHGQEALTKVVSDVKYVPSKDGKGNISFKLNKDASGNPYRGNAVVCLYDKDNKQILWSWHLWLTEQPEEKLTGGKCASGSYSTTLNGYIFTADATDGPLTIMDRNLGAISATPSDGWKTYGLYYQMGRKDPFIGGDYEGNYADRSTGLTTDILGSENFNSVCLWEKIPFCAEGSVRTKGTHWTVHDDMLAPNGWKYQGNYINLTTSIRSPMIFSSTNTKDNTIWTKYDDADNNTYMDINAGNVFDATVAHTTGLKSSGHEAYWNRTKTIFDPCPAGWTILGERGGVFLGSDTRTASGIGKALGITTTYTYMSKTYSTWWPAAGIRTTKGTMAEVGYRGAYFHYDHIEATHGGHGFSFHLNSSSSYTMDKFNAVMTNHACSIRCVKAKQLNSTGK